MARPAELVLTEEGCPSGGCALTSAAALSALAACSGHCLLSPSVGCTLVKAQALPKSGEWETHALVKASLPECMALGQTLTKGIF